MVLGVDWLRNFGSILWKFTNLTMQFNFMGSEFLLQGLHPSREVLKDMEHIKLKKEAGKGI